MFPALLCVIRKKGQKRMLQVFHVDIAKVERDVAYVAIVVYVCCKRLFLTFHLFSTICCKCVYYLCITHMMQLFYLDVVYVCNDFQVFLQVFETHVSSISSIFFLFCKCCI
jgi:hypothetical protein